MFKRRSTAEAPTDDVLDPTGEGKGHATPSRKEAEAARQARVKPPRNSKEAKARSRAQNSESRTARRAALMSGDPRYLPARDQGEVRAFVRDYIDCRRRVGELVLPVAVVVIILGFVPAMAAYTYLGFYALILGVLADAIGVRFRLRRELSRRFPDEARGGHTFYAVMRSLQIRRLRVPKPRVAIGQPI